MQPIGTMPNPAEVAHGPMFVGYLMNVTLYGVMITQVYLYWTSCKRDRTWMKLFVALLFLCDTVNTVFDTIYLYASLILHFGDNEYLGRANWVFATDPIMTAIIAILVQGFFAWRIKVLTGSNWLVGAVLVGSLTGFIGGAITSVEVGKTPEFVNFRNFKWSVIMWLAGACCGDILITIILVLHFHKTGFQASDDVVDRVIRMTVQTGLITAVCAVIDLALFLADPTGLHLIFNFPLSKLYTNSLMSSLNSRGVGNQRTGANIYTGSVPHTTHTTPIKVPNFEAWATSKVMVTAESHQTRDVESRRETESINNDPVDRGFSAIALSARGGGFNKIRADSHI